jgi:hypothetical protein
MIHYRTAGDGTVVAWGREKDPPNDTSCWGASAWTADPRTEEASHIGRLCADADHEERDRAIDAYLDAHGGGQ